MRVIFLDIDGVLNSIKLQVAYRALNPGKPISMLCSDLMDQYCLGLVAQLCRETEARIVISSSWRVLHSLKEIIGIMKQNGWSDVEDYVIGVTPQLRENRGHEIQAWLDSCETVGDYVILDDDADMLDSQMGNFVLVDGYEGLSFANFAKAARILGDDSYERMMRLGS